MMRPPAAYLPAYHVVSRMRGLPLVLLILLAAGCASPSESAPVGDPGNASDENASASELEFEEGWNESTAPAESAESANKSAETSEAEADAGPGEDGADGEPGEDGADGEDCGENSTSVNVGSGNC